MRLAYHHVCVVCIFATDEMILLTDDGGGKVFPLYAK